MREVLGIPREWTLHFPDQMTMASIWKAANNNCLFFFFRRLLFLLLKLFLSLCCRYTPIFSEPFVSEAASQDRREQKHSPVWFILSYWEHIYVAHLACTQRFLSGTIWQLEKESHALHFHPADYQPEQVEADLMNPNEEARPMFAAAAHDPICVLKCQPLIEFLEMQL